MEEQILSLLGRPDYTPLNASELRSQFGLRNDQGKLEGNFGVVYTIKARLENPTLQPADIEVIFESSAGYSGGLFVVNGRMVRTPLLQPKEEAQITRVHLGPGENESLRILTFPLSGGSYPATLTIRPVGH